MFTHFDSISILSNQSDLPGHSPFLNLTLPQAIVLGFKRLHILQHLSALIGVSPLTLGRWFTLTRVGTQHLGMFIVFQLGVMMRRGRNEHGELKTAALTAGGSYHACSFPA